MRLFGKKSDEPIVNKGTNENVDKVSKAVDIDPFSNFESDEDEFYNADNTGDMSDGDIYINNDTSGGDDIDLFGDDLYRNEDSGRSGYVEANVASSYDKPNNSANAGLFSDNAYEADIIEESAELDDKALKNALTNLARRGHVIVVTGEHDSGVSTMALNMSYLFAKLGYKTLLMDFDTVHRAQHFMSRDNNDSLDKGSTNVTKLFDKNADIYSCITLVRKNLHIVANGLACEPESLLNVNGFNRIGSVINSLRRDYGYIIVDMPPEYIESGCEGLIELCDEILLTIDASNHGCMNIINLLCNIEDNDVLDQLFSSKTSIIYNRDRGMKKLLGRPIDLKKSSSTRVMDAVVKDIAEVDIGYHFSDMKIVGLVGQDGAFEQLSGEKKQYCDTPNGYKQMLSIIKKIFN